MRKSPLLMLASLVKTRLETSKQGKFLWLFIEQGTAMYLSAHRTCSTTIFPHLTNRIIDLWRSRPRCQSPLIFAFLLRSTLGERSPNLGYDRKPTN